VPHPAEKIIKQVRAGKMPQSAAWKRISEVMYDLEKEGVPSKWKSDNWRRRIEALTKRVKSEDEFMRELIKYVKTKSRFD